MGRDPWISNQTCICSQTSYQLRYPALLRPVLVMFLRDSKTARILWFGTVGTSRGCWFKPHLRYYVVSFSILPRHLIWLLDTGSIQENIAIWLKNVCKTSAQCVITIQVQIGKHFQRKIVNIFLSISFNICFGCSKEPSQWDSSFEYLQHMFWLRNKKINFDYALLSGGLYLLAIIGAILSKGEEISVNLGDSLVPKEISCCL